MCTMTYHAKVERQARINYILDTIGIGEPVVKVRRPSDGRFLTLTDTGVLMVTTMDSQLVTMFIIEMEEAIKLYRRGTNRHNMPDGLYKRIRSAQKYRRNQP